MSTRRAVADPRVVDGRVRADLGSRADARRSEQAHPGAHDGVVADRHAGLDPGGPGLQEGHALPGVVLEDPRLRRRLGLHQVGAVVHADRAGGVVGQVRGDPLVALAQDPDRPVR